MTDSPVAAPPPWLWTAQSAGRITLPGSAQPVAVPSGQSLVLQDVIIDQPSPDAVVYRYRYVAPAVARLGGTLDFATSLVDMQHLCETYARQNLGAPLAKSVQVIISFSDVALPFGQANPEATQFFVAFDIKDRVCTLDPF